MTNRTLMRWFWVAADGKTVVSLSGQLSGDELRRSVEEGWHRLYNNIHAYATDDELDALGATPAASPAPIHTGSVVRDDSLSPSILSALGDAGISIKGIGGKSIELIRELYPVEEVGVDEDREEE